MLQYGIAKLLCRLLLQLLYHLITELGNPGALNADYVVVVSVFGNIFLAGLPVSELPFNRKGAVGQEFHRPVDRGISDTRGFSPDLFKQLIKTYMRYGLKKDISNNVALLSGLKSPLIKARVERIHLYGVFGLFHNFLYINSGGYLNKALRVG